MTFILIHQLRHEYHNAEKESCSHCHCADRSYQSEQPFVKLNYCLTFPETCTFLCA